PLYSKLFPYTTLFRSHLRIVTLKPVSLISVASAENPNRSVSRLAPDSVPAMATEPLVGLQTAAQGYGRRRPTRRPSARRILERRSEEHTSELQSPCNL